MPEDSKQNGRGNMEDTGAASNGGTKRIVIKKISLEGLEVVGCSLKLIQMGIFGILCESNEIKKLLERSCLTTQETR
ncbi:hypothetical protein GOBAR_AA25752 [Gossypium barbadense]|uniref:Uncharacterized protein n=1 Tax=Gossypium barbadense TaxID=3634 RepID=A0A2P5WUY6_GOSBA|nr:hypothetical protein GOBAR_AA25752 [Gossypium barbadense]